ncbi:MAG: hypothetical protein Q9187_005939 [Circinaria calcarea]
MVAPRKGFYTTGSSEFVPDAFFDSWEKGTKSAPDHNQFRASVISNFGLRKDDSYVYHAIASVTLDQVQAAVHAGGQNGLHDWYLDEDGKTLPPPSPADILAYTSIFASTTSTPKALTAYASNAKKASLRATIAAYLLSHRLFPPSFIVPKLKSRHTNPYYDYWAWSCQNLSWAGPDENTIRVKHSHHILPILMHHFGCVCPSYEALEIIKQTAQTRAVIEIGSGNGYWTYLLRRIGLSVIAVDSGESEYRTMWIPDTIFTDGIAYLKKHTGAIDAALLLVYPIVGAGFTAKVLDAYKGDTVTVVGTQNANGYTAFKDMTIVEYMKKSKGEFERVAQLPLPSFAGKDEALFVFRRRV